MSRCPHCRHRIWPWQARSDVCLEAAHERCHVASVVEFFADRPGAELCRAELTSFALATGSRTAGRMLARLATTPARPDPLRWKEPPLSPSDAFAADSDADDPRTDRRRAGR